MNLQLVSYSSTHYFQVLCVFLPGGGTAEQGGGEGWCTHSVTVLLFCQNFSSKSTEEGILASKHCSCIWEKCAAELQASFFYLLLQQTVRERQAVPRSSGGDHRMHSDRNTSNSFNDPSWLHGITQLRQNYYSLHHRFRKGCFN